MSLLPQSPPKPKFQVLIMDSHQVNTDPLSQQSSEPQANLEQFSQSENSQLVHLIKAYHPHPKKKIYKQGTLLDFKSDVRWMLVHGNVKVTTTSNQQFVKSGPFVFCISAETCRVIQQVEVLTKSLFYTIPQTKFKDFIRNALFLWNAEKIKFLKNSTLLEWRNHNSIEDAAMNLEQVNLSENLYEKDEEAEAIYWIKEGTISLERKLNLESQPLLVEYQKSFDPQLTVTDHKKIKFIAKKGMIIGLDGLFIKNDSEPNPESPKQKKNVSPFKRFYTARCQAQCTLYKLKKEVVEVFFKLPALKKEKQEEHISNRQLDRICVEYTNLLKSQKINKIVGKKSSYIFEGVFPSLMTQQLQKKKKRISEIKRQEQKVRKLNMSNNAHEVQPPKKVQQPNITKNTSLPSLHQKYLEKLIKKSETRKMVEKKQQIKKGQKILQEKEESDAPTVHHIELLPRQKMASNGKKGGTNFMKVRSYRSLIPVPF